MYRSAARRLLPALRRRTGHPPNQASTVPFSAPVINRPACSTAATSENTQHPNPNNFDFSYQSSSNEGENPRVEDRPKAQWQDEQARVLHASLRHVYFMDDCLKRLIDTIDLREDLKNLLPRNRVAKLVQIRLEMQAPYISKWAHALSIQAQPPNIATSFKQRAMLVDEIWDAAGDESTDTDWYVKRTVLGGIYSTAELYMLSDNSPDFRDTWAFLDGRVKEAFDLKKTVQEAKYLVEAVGAGMGGSVEGFFKSFLKR
ncbi:Unknown protein [Striga hermonthica]|uniref:Ubiquinone biosynthesis protein n=1 Tax=Striga hermonthica TaxID=68872 RepID=A0A9N7R7J8_STRHE|nr:Unknown protein [Striga hermonthica]